MTQQEVKTHKYSNGLTLVTETMPDVSSAAFGILVPAGAAYDPEGRNGTASVLSELLFRGAKNLDNRELNQQLDNLGLHRQGGAGGLHCNFSGALVNDNLLNALELHSFALREPHLDDQQFELCKQLAIQSLDSLDDDPRQKISLLVKEQFLSWPHGRPPVGKRDEIVQLSCIETKKHWASHFTPHNTIIAVAGKVDFDQLKDAIAEYFGAWQGNPPEKLPELQLQGKVYHLPNEGAQVHIALMYPSAHYRDQDYYKALLAVNVLSGGMGSRLFTEVREKRGLCYAVGAGHRVIGSRGAVLCYVGSSPDKAQEALDVMTAELQKLADGVTVDELERAKVGLRASLIMQGESSSARASGCASDYYHLERVRSLEEIESAIQAVTLEELLTYVKNYPPGNFAAATIGPVELEMKF